MSHEESQRRQLELASTGSHPAVAAWPAALQEHASWLRAVIFARVGTSDAVEEVLQDVAYEAARGVEKLRDAQKLGPWLYRVAICAAMRWRRSQGRQRNLTERYAEERQPTSCDPRQTDPLDWLIAEEQRTLVRQALTKLPAGDAQILLLKHTQDWSYQQIADHLGVTSTTVDGRLHRARKKLRQLLATQ